MVVNQRGRTGRKPTGSRYKNVGSKRLHQRGSLPTLTKIGKKKVKTVKTKGGNAKMKVMETQTANVFDPNAKTFVQSPIKSVIESDANRHFVRRNIIVKGTVIETEAGKAKVTSRPGQDGTVNAVLM